MSLYEKKLKDKKDNEIGLAGLVALVPEELEKHLMLNSNRLRTFGHARLEIVTFVEAKFMSSFPSLSLLRSRSGVKKKLAVLKRAMTKKKSGWSSTG